MDTRSQRSNTYGSKLSENTLDTNRVARRIIVSLYDQDGACNDFLTSCSESDDDLLGTTYSDATDGSFCFPHIGDLEDIYYKTRYESDDTEAWGEDGNRPVSVSIPTEFDFGNAGSGTYTKHWNITCTNDSFGTCDKWLADNYFPAEEAFANVMASAVDVDVLVSPDSLFHLNGSSSKIKIFYPDDPWFTCSASQAFRDYLCIDEGAHIKNHTVAHELGHVLQMRALNFSSGTLHDCGGSHNWWTDENEKCTTGEGWAHFVAGATYFYPWASSPFAQDTGQSLEGLYGSDVCVLSSSNPHRREGNVARFFWDLYDSTVVYDANQGYIDNTQLSFGSLVSTWDEFPSGTANRKASEGDSNGRNVYDFAFYESAAEGEIYVNCLTSQDTN